MGNAFEGPPGLQGLWLQALQGQPNPAGLPRPHMPCLPSTSILLPSALP